MKLVPVDVISRTTGAPRGARLVVCANCNESKFIVFLIGTHQHLQCAHCDTTFCDGSCKETKS